MYEEGSEEGTLLNFGYVSLYTLSMWVCLRCLVWRSMIKFPPLLGWLLRKDFGDGTLFIGGEGNEEALNKVFSNYWCLFLSMFC